MYFSLLSLLAAIGLSVVGCVLIIRTRDVSGNIGTTIYQLYGEAILGLTIISQIPQIFCRGFSFLRV